VGEGVVTRLELAWKLREKSQTRSLGGGKKQAFKALKTDPDQKISLGGPQ